MKIVFSTQSKEIYCNQNRIYFFHYVFILGLLICNGSAIDSEIIYWKIVQGKYPNDDDEDDEYDDEDDDDGHECDNDDEYDHVMVLLLMMMLMFFCFSFCFFTL